MLVEKSADDCLKHFYYYLRTFDFVIPCKLSPRDNVHAISKHISGGNKKSSMCWSAADFTLRVVKADIFIKP